MDALLKHVLEAGGGVDRWKEVSSFESQIAYGGPFWEFKGQADFVGTDAVEAKVHEQYLRAVQGSTGRVVEYDKKADRVTVTGPEGDLIESLVNPRASFEGYTPDTAWSVAQMAYFRSYATWHYLVEPYLFTYPGVEAHEVEPWVENGETWRGLSVTFPDTIDTHNDTQLYYFDDAGHLRRMDYQPVVNGYSPTAHYVRKEETVDGFVVATQRRIHIRNEDRTPDLSWTPITLDLSNSRFS
jgi:hypothetical protein